MEEIKVNFENLKQEEREWLLALVKKANKPQSKVWKPKDEEDCWYVDYEGDIESFNWYGSDFDRFLYASGNCFRTREEAEFYKEKLLVTAELQRFADEHNGEIDWEDDSSLKYYLYYDYADEKVLIDFSYFIKHSDIIFSNENICQQAIETIGEERIKKYYLGVKE